MFAFFGVPGIFELLIICFVLGVPIIVVAVVLATQRRTGPNQSNNPNLRPCPDCGRFVSKRAITCPHCGGPVKGA